MVGCGTGEHSDKSFMSPWILHGGLERDIELPTQLLDAKIIKISTVRFASAQHEISFYPPCRLAVVGWQTAFDPLSNPSTLEPSSNGKKVPDHLNYNHGE